MTSRLPVAARPLTLVGLRSLGDVDGELTAERVDSHHARVGGGAGERRQLVVTARDAVESLGEVGRPLQDDLLLASTAASC